MRLRHLSFMARAAPSVLRRKLRSNVTCRAQLTRGPSSYFRADATGTPHLAITAAAAPVALPGPVPVPVLDWMLRAVTAGAEDAVEMEEEEGDEDAEVDT